MTLMTGSSPLEFRGLPEPDATGFVGNRLPPSARVLGVVDGEWRGTHRFLAERFFLHSGVHHRNAAKFCSKTQGMAKMLLANDM